MNKYFWVDGQNLCLVSNKKEKKGGRKERRRRKGRKKERTKFTYSNEYEIFFKKSGLFNAIGVEVRGETPLTKADTYWLCHPCLLMIGLGKYKKWFGWEKYT